MEGDIVYAKAIPDVKLIVRRYVYGIYYCLLKEDPTQKDLVYFERELESVVGIIDTK